MIRELGFPDPGTFLASYERASAWLDGLGIPPERTVIGGFSQGAVMSYALGLGTDRPRPAGVLALSGFIPTVEGFALDLDRPLPPIAIGHGTYDPVIGVEWGRQAKEQLQRRARTCSTASIRSRTRSTPVTWPSYSTGCGRPSAQDRPRPQPVANRREEPGRKTVGARCLLVNP